MLGPEQDQDDRRLIWDGLQAFWMDTDPSLDLERVASICVQSKYSLPEIEQIFWNEVRPAVRFNLFSLAGEWIGFELEWLSQRILKTNRFGKRLPIEYFHPHSAYWWRRLAAEIERLRNKTSGLAIGCSS